jgi:molybdopterin molybdotransferase
VFGLPGNPVSTIVTLLLLVKPALWHMAGNSEYKHHVFRAPLAQTAKHSPGRHEYQRGRLEQTESGTVVQTTSDQSSNRLQSFANANCLFLLPGETAELEKGQWVDVLPFDGLS